MGVRGEPTKWDKWYSTARWARIRRHQLREHPFCAFCLERGIVTAAEICDHVEPHHGDVNSRGNGFQSTRPLALLSAVVTLQINAELPAFQRARCTSHTRNHAHATRLGSTSPSPILVQPIASFDGGAG